MTREELQQRLQFIQDEQVTKNLSVFVTTKTTGLQLFNIREDDMGELLNMFIGSVKEKLIDDVQYSIEDYSTTILRENTIYRYDLKSKSFQGILHAKEAQKHCARSSSSIQTILSASEFHRILPYGSRAVPPVGIFTLP